MAQDSMTLTPIGTYETGLFDEGAQEIGVYDAGSQRLFITNADADALDILDISDPTAPVLVNNITFSEFGSGVNSAAVFDGLVVAAVEAEDVDANGVLVFMDIDGNVLNTVEAGVLPDMVTFTEDGMYAVSANEGEPSDDYSIDPEGSVTVVDLSNGVEEAVATQVTFGDFNADGARASELPEGVRVFGPGASVAQDLEPEYVATADGLAYVSMQENNALAVIDIANAQVAAIVALGTKDFSVEGNGFDASNEDGAINIQTWPVVGMYQPDAIATVEIDGTVYILTANEGDARDYDTFSEEARLGDEEYVLDADAFPNAEELSDEANLGRLKVTTVNGDTDGDGDYDVIYAYGARSFTIWTTDGEIVFDSGDQFEQITAELVPTAFNGQGVNADFDDRSDDKGPEPEAVVTGVIDGSTYAFIGLERIGGVMVYDITDPAMPTFVTYANNVNLEGDAEAGTAGDIGPEGLIFISAEESPNGMNLLVVTNEVSGSTTIYEIGGMME